MNDLFDLTGLTALVTGCNKGIGLSMALRLAEYRRAAGGKPTISVALPCFLPARLPAMYTERSSP